MMTSRQVLLLAVLIFLTAACSSQPETRSFPEYPPKPMAVDFLLGAFEHGSEITIGGRKAGVHTIKIAALYLPDGRVVVADPFVEPGRGALAWTLNPGSYDVILSVATFDVPEDSVVMAVKLVVSDREPVQWVLATTPEQDPSKLAQDEIYGYPVDSGTGSMMSPQSAALLEERVIDRFGNIDIDFLQEIHQATMQNAASGYWIDLRLDDEARLNAVLGLAGYGDGFYASYWGLDGEGEIVCLVTDFGIYPED